MNTRSTILTICGALILTGSSPATAQWSGFRDESTALSTDRYAFFGANPEAGGNENYYDGDFGDVDGDGLPDRLLGARYGLLHNQGGGYMVPIRRHVGLLLRGDVGAGGWGEDAMLLVDIDGDGDLDSLSGGNGGEPLSCQLNTGWRWSTAWSLPHRALNIVPTDIDGDDDVDLLVGFAFCMSCGGRFAVLRNDGTGNFTDYTRPSGLALSGTEGIVGVASADVDGDGDFDVLTLRGTSQANARLHVGLNDGRGVFTARPQPLPTNSSGFHQALSLGDIDDDGDLDVVIGRGSTYAGGHPRVPHVIALNDGNGNFTDRSASMWTGNTGELAGSNIVLLDVDYDGDLDVLSMRVRPDIGLNTFLNDGTGRMVHTPGRSFAWAARPGESLGVDVDISDIDGDGSYDVWLGAGSNLVHILLNTYSTPTGVPADIPRNVRVVREAADGVTIGWQNPDFATNVRRYNVYRSTSPNMDDPDRELVHVVGRSRFLDQDFFGTIDRHTTTADLGDPAVTIAGSGEVQFRDTSARPGVRYYYAVSHVGPEHDESEQSPEVSGVRSRGGGADTQSPDLRIVSPTVQSWSPSPRIVLSFGDDMSGIDLSTLQVSFSRAYGSVAAGDNLRSLAYRADGNTLIIPLANATLPSGIVTVDASVSDNAGNQATASVRFAAGASSSIRNSPMSPSAAFSASTVTGTAPLNIDFDATASTDPDGHLMRWEWYWGDGGTDLGRNATHRFESAGTYDVMLLVRDTHGNVDTSTRTIVLDGPPPMQDAGPRPDAGVGDAGTGMDAMSCMPMCMGRSCGDDGCGGTCGACGASEVCAAGACECSGANVACSAECTDVLTDVANCGGCGLGCASGEQCLAGRCGTGECIPDCSGRSCGGDGCGGSCGECQNAQVCAAGGQCLCEGGELGCGDACVDVRTNDDHCGACGSACGDGAHCESGACVTDAEGEGGCSIHGGGTAPAFGLLVLGLAIWRRRNRMS